MSALSPIQTNCVNRVRPTILRDRKTEALLVFARTALERYFQELDQTDFDDIVDTNEDIHYVYATLKNLLTNLQESVVNVDYLINVTQISTQYPNFKSLALKEKALIEYYNAMASVVKEHYRDQNAYLPELLVICVLEEWLLGEEKSTALYPFLNEVDYLEVIGKFEINRKSFEKDGVCKISEIHALSSKIVSRLKNYKYMMNKSRISKTRKKNG